MSTKQGIVDEIYSAYRRNFQRRPVTITSIYQALQCDLLELTSIAKHNDGYKFILVVVNIFSKMTHAIPVKTKNATDVTNAFAKIIKELEFVPKQVQCDAGGEFWNRKMQKLLKDNGMYLYKSFSTKKAQIVERKIRDIRRLLFKHFNRNATYRYVDVLPDIIETLNERHNRTIGMRPIDVSLENHENLVKRFKKLEKEKLRRMKRNKKPHFNVGDNVRISIARSVFSKEYGFSPNWSLETFTVQKVLDTKPVTYILQDSNNKKILGSFYAEELKKTKYPGIWLISRIIKTDKRKRQHYVQFLGESKPRWIPLNDLIDE
jgi:hypothetical protein